MRTLIAPAALALSLVVGSAAFAAAPAPAASAMAKPAATATKTSTASKKAACEKSWKNLSVRRMENCSWRSIFDEPSRSVWWTRVRSAASSRPLR